MLETQADALIGELRTIGAALLEQNRLTDEANRHLGRIAEKLADLEPTEYFTDRDGCLMVHATESKDLKRIGDQIDNMARAIDGFAGRVGR